jgi:hypothetical protein
LGLGLGLGSGWGLGLGLGLGLGFGLGLGSAPTDGWRGCGAGSEAAGCVERPAVQGARPTGTRRGAHRPAQGAAHTCG